MLYTWIVFLHVATVLLFVLGHGVSAAVSLRTRTERDPVRIGALLDLSRWSLNVAGIGLLGIIVTGLAAGWAGDWFGRAWFWVSIVVLVVVGGLMTPLGRGYLDDVRLAVGVPTGNRKKDAEPRVVDVDRLPAILADSRPITTSILGSVGLLVLLWLMYFKPF
jgi:hypothetical protein